MVDGGYFLLTKTVTVVNTVRMVHEIGEVRSVGTPVFLAVNSYMLLLITKVVLSWGCNVEGGGRAYVSE